MMPIIAVAGLLASPTPALDQIAMKTGQFRAGIVISEAGKVSPVLASPAAKKSTGAPQGSGASTMVVRY